MTDNCPRTTFYLFRLGNLLIEVSKSPETKIREGAFKALFESLEHHRIKRKRRKCFEGRSIASKLVATTAGETVARGLKHP
jgi:hypothetical protein